jgi:hypothetical protein
MSATSTTSAVIESPVDVVGTTARRCAFIDGRS